MAFDQQTVAQARQALQTAALQYGMNSAEYHEMLALPDHATQQGNVHQETKASVGVENLKNYRPAVSADVESAAPATKYSTPQSTKTQIKKELAAKSANLFKINNKFDQRTAVSIKASETTAREILVLSDPVTVLFINDGVETPQYRLLIEKENSWQTITFQQGFVIDPHSNVSDFTEAGRYYVEAYQVESNQIVAKVTHVPYGDGINISTVLSESSWSGDGYFGFDSIIPIQYTVDNSALMNIINPGNQYEVLTSSPTWVLFNYWGRFYLVPNKPMLKNVRWSDIAPSLNKAFGNFGRIGILNTLTDNRFPVSGNSPEATEDSMFNIFFNGVTSTWATSPPSSFGFGDEHGAEWAGGDILSHPHSRVVRGSTTTPSHQPAKTVDTTDVTERYSYRPIIEIIQR